MGTSTSELARRALSLLPLLLLLLRPTCVVSTEPLTFTVSPGAEGETPLQVRSRQESVPRLSLSPTAVVVLGGENT